MEPNPAQSLAHLVHQEMHLGKVHFQNSNWEKVPASHSYDEF